MPQELTLPEAIKKIGEYEAKFTKMNSDLESLTTYVAEAKKAEAKRAEAEAKKGESEEEKMAEAKKEMEAALEEKDPEKVREKIAEAHKKMGMKYGEAKKAETDGDEDKKEDDEEKEAMKAELKKPRLQVLTAQYKGKVEPKILDSYVARWNKMSFKELDAEIDMIKPFMGKVISTNTATSVPLGFSTLETPYVGSKKDEYSASLEKLSDNELFGGKL